MRYISNQAQEIIEEICQDIGLYGYEKEVYLIYDKQTKELTDFDYDEKPDILYIDEERKKATLFDALITWIIAAKNTEKQTSDFCQYNAMIIASRLLREMTQEEFAELIGKSIDTVRSWETGRRKATHEMASEVYKICQIEVFKSPLTDLIEKKFKA